MKVEAVNNYCITYPQLKDIPVGDCAWIQGTDEPDSPFDVLVMVTNVEGSGESYVCLENGYTRPIGNCFMSYRAIPTKVKIVLEYEG